MPSKHMKETDIEAGERLRLHFDSIERAMIAVAAARNNLTIAKKSAKSAGYDVGILVELITDGARTPAEQQARREKAAERDRLLETYQTALEDTPLEQAIAAAERRDAEHERRNELAEANRRRLVREAEEVGADV